MMPSHSDSSRGGYVFGSVVDEQCLVCMDTEQIEGRAEYLGMRLYMSD